MSQKQQKLQEKEGEAALWMHATESCAVGLAAASLLWRTTPKKMALRSAVIASGGRRSGLM